MPNLDRTATIKYGQTENSFHSQDRTFTNESQEDDDLKINLKKLEKQ